MGKRFNYFLGLSLIGLMLWITTACTPTVATIQSTPEPPTAIAKNPVNVWIDQPLPNQILTINQLPEQIIAHASGLSGTATLHIHDKNNTLIATVDLGSPTETTITGGKLTRYTGYWLSVLINFLNTLDGITTLKLTVMVDGVVSEPVILTVLAETPTPTITPSLTVTPAPTMTVTSTATPTMTQTITSSPTITPSLTSTPSPSATLTPTTTPTETATSTTTATITPSSTLIPSETLPPSVPDIPYFPKPEIPCELIPKDSEGVPARVGPGTHRGIIKYISGAKALPVIGYNDDSSWWWWQILLNGDTEAWVDSENSLTIGSCLLEEYVSVPDIIIAPQPTIPPIGTIVPTLAETLSVTLTPTSTLPPGVTPSITPIPSATMLPSPAPCFGVTSSVTPPGTGSISLSAPNCGGLYTQGSGVTASATPSAGNVTFDHWSGTCVAGNSTNSTIVFTINNNCSLIANFVFIVE